ncbi:MAG: hypothetical protein EOM66_07805, partial [Clostridia bacterium]|nr:hypothetical protein [Clostridia bacterium]
IMLVMARVGAHITTRRVPPLMSVSPTHRPTGQMHRPQQVPPQKRHRRSRLPRLMRLAGHALILLAVLFIASLVVWGQVCALPSDKKLQDHLDKSIFFNGIVIDDKNVAGMTIPEAREALLPHVEASAAIINIGIRHKNSLWLFTAADLKAKSNLDTVLAEAMLVGRSGTRSENRKVLRDLEENGRKFTVTFTADEGALAARLATIGRTIDTLPVEPSAEPYAFWASSESKLPSFTYAEGVNGYILDETTLAKEILACLSAGNYQAQLDPELVLTEPKTTLNQIQANTQLRATYQTDFSSRSGREKNRVGNIQKATTLLNGAVVQPGETLDFNEFIGPRTEAGGWPLAPGIVNGDRYEMQPGGGICQVSTTLYISLLEAGAVRSDVKASAETALAAPINITERNKHSWPSAYADRGLDATVSTGGKNLVFINQMDTPLYIFADCDQVNYKMTIYIYGQPLPEGVHYVPEGITVEELAPGETEYTDNPDWPVGYEQVEAKGRVGYVADVYINTYQGDELVSKDLIYTDRYRAVAQKVIRGTGDATLPPPTNPAAQ